MSEYCEYMWDPSRGRLTSTVLTRSIYDDDAKLDVKDRKLAIKTVRAILRGMPGVDLNHCTDEYVTRFLLARKYRTEQAAALIAAYQSQIAHRQDIFGNLTARDPSLQRALRAGIPGVLPARDRKGRCVLVILASQWDPIAVPALSVQRAIFLVLETLIQDPRNQQCGFVAVIDWSGFSLRQGGALGAAALRNLIAALRGRFPARFKAIHFLSAPLCVQATLALVKPFLDEKTRHKIYLHGNNLSTLHEHLPTDILPAELGGTGPAFNPGLWAEPVIHSAMKEAELAAIKRDKELAERAANKSAKGTMEKNGEENGEDIDDSTKLAVIEKRTPGNGESDNGKTIISTNVQSPPKLEPSKCKKMSVNSRDLERPDGKESEITSSQNAKSPLIDTKKKSTLEKSENRLSVDQDSSYEKKSKENTKSSLVNERSNEFARKNVSVDVTGKSMSKTSENHRANDDRTRFRVYRDNFNASDAETTGNDSEDGRKIVNNGNNEDLGDCVESETNSNEFEMISSQPESDESRENSIVTLRVDKIVSTKNGKNASLPEEVNLIT